MNNSTTTSTTTQNDDLLSLSKEAHQPYPATLPPDMLENLLRSTRGIVNIAMIVDGSMIAEHSELWQPLPDTAITGLLNAIISLAQKMNEDLENIVWGLDDQKRYEATVKTTFN